MATFYSRDEDTMLYFKIEDIRKVVITPLKDLATTTTLTYPT